MATILIVDDLAPNRALLVSLLGYGGHRLLEATEGRQALALIASDPPDLVITDVLMPVMDGYELVRQLRDGERTREIPVIFYTAHYGEREARELAIASGVAAVIVKPAEPVEVIATVDRVLRGSAGVPAASLGSAEVGRQHLRLLTDKLSDTTEVLKAANARLRALVNIGLELASERDADRLLRTVASATRDLFGVQYVTVGIVERDTTVLHHFIVDGAPDSACLVPGDRLNGLLEDVVSTQLVHRGENRGGDPVALGLPATHPRLHAYLVAPISSPTHKYGWMLLARDVPFVGDDEDLITALGGMVGRIYENGHLYAVAQARATALEQEVVERQKAEAHLKAAEERTRFALASADVGIWDMDYRTGVLRWSEILEAQYGYAPGTFPGTFEEFLSRIAEDDRKTVLQTISSATAEGADFHLHHRIVTPGGAVRWLRGAGRIHCDPDGTPIRGVGISMDVTDQHKLEMQYQQAQKMEAIGRLAGGIAHDFNNLLTSILGYCELLQEDIAESDPRRLDIEEIQKSGITAASLTRQLLAFSRKQIVEPVILELNAVLVDMQRMLQRLIGEDVQVVFSLSPDAGRVMADRGQVEQIVLNLAVNARDAMPRGGTLTIETLNVELDDHYARTHVNATPGHYVALIVSDTGTGMSPEVQQLLFEPFFTTKEPGKGTGLGLATVHGIVTGGGGTIQVYSEPGQGSAFQVYLPRMDAPVVPEAPVAAAAVDPSGVTVLVVDDAAGLRELARRLLSRAGFQVLVAADADDARAIFAQHDIDVLLTDVVMPGASGPELTEALKAERPGLKVVYMSGYTEETIVHHGVLDQGIAFLHKPFTSQSLLRKLHEVLAR